MRILMMMKVLGLYDDMTTSMFGVLFEHFRAASRMAEDDTFVEGRHTTTLLSLLWYLMDFLRMTSKSYDGREAWRKKPSLEDLPLLKGHNYDGRRELPL